MSSATSQIPRIRGSEAVQAALIEAAAELLGEVGPKSLSVRDIAERAGVNHGQIHHYFGGKRGLLEAAIRHLAKGHFEHSRELADGGDVPPPLALTEDRPYFRAVCQSVMDGDLDLVMTVDADDELSVPRRVLRALRGQHRQREDDLDLRAGFAVVAATQLGWVAFEELMLLNAEVTAEERERFLELVKGHMQAMFDRLSPRE